MTGGTVSVVIITKNEEDKIGRCLESVRWADEIIIVDDISADRTVKICREFGAKVISHKSYGNFDRQRNIGIENTCGEWILQMDADEVVPCQLKEEIKKVTAQKTDFSAFQFRRKNFFLGHFMRYGGFYGAYSLKLFKKSKAVYTGHSVHETLKVDGNIGTIEADIEHYPFQSISQNIIRTDMYTSVESRLMKEDKGKIDIKEIRYNLTIRPLKTFWKMYVKRKAYKDGMHGLIFSILFTFSPMLKWMKYWELVKNDLESGR